MISFCKMNYVLKFFWINFICYLYDLFFISYLSVFVNLIVSNYICNLWFFFSLLFLIFRLVSLVWINVWYVKVKVCYFEFIGDIKNSF